MESIFLITIVLNPLEQYNLASKNEPSKIQLSQLLLDLLKDWGRDGAITYIKFTPAAGEHKIYEFLVGKQQQVIIEVKRLQIVEFEKK